MIRVVARESSAWAWDRRPRPSPYHGPFGPRPLGICAGRAAQARGCEKSTRWREGPGWRRRPSGVRRCAKGWGMSGLGRRHFRHRRIRSRHVAASGTISSARNHVNPRAASVWAYAHCATRLDVASSPTIPCCPSASPNCAPYCAFRSGQAARCSQAGSRSRFLLLHRLSANTKLCARSTGYRAQATK